MKDEGLAEKKRLSVVRLAESSEGARPEAMWARDVKRMTGRLVVCVCEYVRWWGGRN